MSLRETRPGLSLLALRKYRIRFDCKNGFAQLSVHDKCLTIILILLLPFSSFSPMMVLSVFGGLVAIFQWTLPKDEKKNSVYIQMQEGKHAAH